MKILWALPLAYISHGIAMNFGVPSFWVYMVMNAYLDTCATDPWGFSFIGYKRS